MVSDKIEKEKHLHGQTVRDAVGHIGLGGFAAERIVDDVDHDFSVGFHLLDRPVRF